MSDKSIHGAITIGEQQNRLLALAINVSGAVGDLNQAIEAAHQAGLSVKIDQLTIEEIGRRSSRVLLSVEVSQPLYRS
jgi:microcompartment protein CcmL/EutN